MRILHTSDWHIGRFLNKFSLIDDQAFFLEWLLKFLKAEKVEILLIAGDLYNTATPSTTAISLLDEFFTKVVLELKVKVFLISGNHDSGVRLSFSSKILKKNGFFVAGGLNGFQKIEFNSSDGLIQFFLMPFFNLVSAKHFLKLSSSASDNQVFNKLFKKFNLDNLSGQFNLLCAHGLFADCGQTLKFCDSELVVGESELFNLNFFKNFNYIALGHLHKFQKAGLNGYYSGSPLKYSTSEANDEKCVILVDIDLKGENRCKITPIKVEPLRDLQVVEAPFSELLKLKTNNYLAAHLTDETFVLNPFTRLQANCPNLLEISYVNLNFKVSNELNKFKKQNPNELFAQFFKSVVGREMNQVERSIFSDVVKDCSIVKPN